MRQRVKTRQRSGGRAKRRVLSRERPLGVSGGPMIPAPHNAYNPS
jgi:hypothetical protein